MMRKFAGAAGLVLCVTLTGCPAIVSVAVRLVCAGFAAIESVTLPVPGTGALAVTHAGRPETVQGHQACVVTLTVLVPAAALAVTVPGVTV